MGGTLQGYVSDQVCKDTRGTLMFTVKVPRRGIVAGNLSGILSQTPTGRVGARPISRRTDFPILWGT